MSSHIVSLVIEVIQAAQTGQNSFRDIVGNYRALSLSSEELVNLAEKRKHDESYLNYIRALVEMPEFRKREFALPIHEGGGL